MLHDALRKNFLFKPTTTLATLKLGCLMKVEFRGCSSIDLTCRMAAMIFKCDLEHYN